MAESELVLERLFAAGASIVVRSLLITPARAERIEPFLQAQVSSQPEHEHVEVFVAPQAVIDAVVGYPLHRGVIAVAERPAPRTPNSVFALARTLVVLEQVMDPDNVGSVFRHAAGFGADAVVLHGPCGDPLYRKTIRTSMGWTLHVPYANTALGEQSISAVLREAGFTTLALTPAGDANDLADVVSALTPTDRVALLLGAEGPGLTPQAIADANHRVRIPLRAGVDSLNVATAGAIALYALTSAHPARI